MYCANCGTSNPDTASICANCGRSLAATPSSSSSSSGLGGGGGSYTPPSSPGSYSPPPPPSMGSGYSPGGPPPGSIPNYLWQSIVVTLCCCLPFGIVAIIFATQVNSKLAAGDVAGAMAASRNAKLWCWISFGVGLAATLLWMVFGGLGVLQGIREGNFQ